MEGLSMTLFYSDYRGSPTLDFDRDVDELDLL